MKLRRSTLVYVLLVLFIVGCGLPTRTVPELMPMWYVRYAGDYLWAMLLFFGLALILRRRGTLAVAITALIAVLVHVVVVVAHGAPRVW